MGRFLEAMIVLVFALSFGVGMAWGWRLGTYGCEMKHKQAAGAP